MAYTAVAPVYDLLYTVGLGRSYADEAAAVHEMIQRHRPGAATLLDVGCGTGAHLAVLAKDYRVAGVDLDPDMLKIAAERLPGVPLHRADMRTLDLGGERFDAVVCLFAAIAHVVTTEGLNAAVAAMARHLAQGGVLIVDGFVRQEEWRDDLNLGVQTATDGERSVVRMTHQHRDGNVVTLSMHHLIGSADGIDHVVDDHRLGLFTDEDFAAACVAAGLSFQADDNTAWKGRSGYVGVKP
jgi:ubiquinone/menaquinone biosynthesis C-methylase UbiE